MVIKTDFYYILYDMLDALWRRRYLVCVTLLIMPLCATFVGSMLPKKYQATTSILVYESALLNPFLKDLAYSTQLKKRITGLNVFINSPTVLKQVAIDSGLVPTDASAYRVQEVAEKLAKSLSIKLLGSNVVSIKLTSSSPEKMVDILTQVRKTFITRLLAPQISSIQSSEKFLTEQIKKQATRLSRAEEQYALYKKNHAEHLPSNTTLYAQQLQKILIRINENETNLAGAEAEVATIRKNLLDSNPLVGHLEMELIKYKANYERLRTKYTSEHSQVKHVQRKIASLNRQKSIILAQIEKLSKEDIKQFWDIAITSTTSLTAEKYQPLLIEQLQNLQQANAKVNRIKKETAILVKQVVKTRKKIAGISLFEKQLNELKRDVEVNQELYQKLKKRLAMASVTGDLGKFEQDKLVKVIELPQVPSKPVNKPLIVFFILGVFGALAMGGGLVVLLEVLDNTVRQAKQVEQYTGVPVLCRVSKLNLD